MGMHSRMRGGAVTIVAGLAIGLVAVVPGSPSGAQTPLPVFTKAFSPATIGPGSTTTLTFTVDNTGDFVPATDLAFGDDLPAEITIADPPNVVNGCGGSFTAVAGGGELALSDGAVGAGATCTIGVDVTASVLGTFTNESGALSSSAGTSGTATADLTVTSGLPGFSKSFDWAEAAIGYRATLTFTIDNSLNAAGVSDFSFTDPLPRGMVVADPSGATTDCGPAALPSAFSTITAVPGSDVIAFSAFGSSPANEVVAAGGTCTIAVDVVAGAAGRAGNSTDDASASVANGPTASAGAANASLDVAAAPLGVVKEFVDDPILPGGTATLRFTLTNYDRGADATDLSFVDSVGASLPGMVAVPPFPVDPCGPGSALSGTASLRLEGGSLAAGASCTYDVSVSVPADTEPGRIFNLTSSLVGTVDGEEVVGSQAFDTLFVVLAPVLNKEFVDDPQGAGGTVTLSFSISNPDPDNPMTDIAFEDLLDPVLPSASVVAGTPAPPPPAVVTVNNVCGAGSSLRFTPLSPISSIPQATIELTAGSLAAGASCSFTVVLDVASAAPSTSYPNTTTPVTAELLGSPVTGGAASDTLVVVGAPPLRKAFLDDPVAPGDTVTLQFTVVNGGQGEGDFDSVGPVTDITFTDDLTFLAGLTAIAPLPTEPCGPGSQLTADVGGTLLTLTGGNLLEDESCTFTVALQTSPLSPQGLFTNTTSDVSAIASGVPVVGPGQSADLIVSDVIVIKDFVDDPVLAGSPVTLAFTIDNRGTLAADSIGFSDDLSRALPGLSFSSIVGDDCGGTLTGSTTLVYSGGSVPAGGSCTLSVELLVPAGAAPGSYRNVTSPIELEIAGSPVTVPAVAAALVVADEPVVGLTKRFLADPVRAGDRVTLRFTLANPSAVAISGIGFSDDLAAVLPGLAAVVVPPAPCGGSLTASAGGTLLTFAGGSVAAGASCVIGVVLVVPSATAPGSYPNTTSAVVADLGITGAPASDVLDVRAPDPDRLRADLSITKSDDVDPVLAGETLTYTVEVFNAGPDTAPGVVVVDTLPQSGGVPLVTLVETVGCLNDPFTLSCELGDLAPGTGASFTIAVQVPVGATGELTNTATVTSGVSDGNLSDNTATETTDVVAGADLSITKRDSADPVIAGTSLTYTIDVANAGPATAFDVVATDVLPAGVSNPSTSGCAGDPDGVAECRLGAIAAGDTASFTVTVDVDPSTTGVITNTASVSAANVDPDTSDNTTSEETTVVASADLSITKSDLADPVIAGGTVEYTVTVANAGPSDATGVVVTDTLPAGLSNPSTAGCGEDPGGVPTCSLGTIGAGDSASFTVSADVDPSAAGTITNVASVTSDADDPDPSDDEVTEDTFVRAGADLAIDKVDDVDPIEAHSHERLTYTITVTNHGPFTAEDVVVTDTLPFGIQFKETVGCAEDKRGVPTCSLGDLAAGASVAYTVEVKMKTQSPLGIMTNTASVSSSTLDQDLSNNTATEDTLVCRKKSDFTDCDEVEVRLPLALPVLATGSSGSVIASPAPVVLAPPTVGSAVAIPAAPSSPPVAGSSPAPRTVVPASPVSSSSPGASAVSSAPASTPVAASAAPGASSVATASAAPRASSVATAPAAATTIVTAVTSLTASPASVGPAPSAGTTRSLPATGADDTSPLTSAALFVLALGLGCFTLSRTQRRRSA